jgi:hypothetical protein
MPREPRKRGISNDQICIENDIDCKGDIVAFLMES